MCMISGFLKSDTLFFENTVYELDVFMVSYTFYTDITLPEVVSCPVLCMIPGNPRRHTLFSFISEEMVFSIFRKSPAFERRGSPFSWF